MDQAVDAYLLRQEVEQFHESLVRVLHQQQVQIEALKMVIEQSGMRGPEGILELERKARVTVSDDHIMSQLHKIAVHPI